MKELGRRRILQLATAFAVMPSLASARAKASTASLLPLGDAIEPFSPPTQPMTYKRRIQRQLADGAQLSVERVFAVQFMKDGSGFRIYGEQTGVEIDAPPALDALMQLERERVATGVFPLDLDQHGIIQFGEDAGEIQQVETALKQVSLRIHSSARGTQEQQELQDFVSAIHKVGAKLTTSLPLDLFAPAQSKRSFSREIALPDGAIGEVVTSFSAERDPCTRLMQQATRSIVTRMDSDARNTVESWSLVPAKA